MKVGAITNIIDRYNLYHSKMTKDKDELFWESVNNGENSLRALKLKKQIKLDEDSFERFKEEEIK